jgi:hypothetical protein
MVSVCRYSVIGQKKHTGESVSLCSDRRQAVRYVAAMWEILNIYINENVKSGVGCIREPKEKET